MTGRFRIDWTEDRLEQLAALWEEGLTAAQIAAQLGGGITRNAVIGRARRLGLAARKHGRPGPRPRKTVTMLDRFAEAIADSAGTPWDGDVVAIGNRLGMPPTQAHVTMQNLRKAMGPQAR